MKRHHLILLFLILRIASPLSAQVSSTPWLTWDDFVEEYVDGGEWEEDTQPDNAQLEWLEGLSQNPLQINRASRSELLELPFVSEEQADSLLSYRQSKHGIHSLGELQLIKGWDYYTRRYLSLFARCDSLPLPSPEWQARNAANNRIAAKLTRGRHEVETRLDFPLYQREGDKQPDKPSATNYFTGNPIHHIVRYRYTMKREAAYGLTMEKDSGEPVGKKGFYPYDHLSGYFSLTPKDKAWSFVLGDYEIRGGRGLLFGRQFFAGREQITQNVRRVATSFRAHTSADESRFFRGGGAAYSFGKADVMAFFSYRKLDARMEENSDTARSILTTGYHRTVSEIERRRNLGCLTAGMHVGYNQNNFGLSLDGYAAHYQHTVWPEERFYNTYYFRGKTAGGISAGYFLKKRKWSVLGELAIDHQMHLATEHTASFTPISRLTANLQVRHFSPQFVSLYGDALQQSGRVANEQGVLVGLRYRSRSNWELNGYLDFYRFPKPTYNCRLDGAKGMEMQLQGKYSLSSTWHFSTRYRMKARQQSITGHAYSMEYRQSHKLRMAAQWIQDHIELNMQLDGTFSTRQTGKRSLGGMASARATWKPSSLFNLKTFAGVFFTDNYESALYAYEPQLLRTASFNAYAYHGARAVAVCNWRVAKPLALSFRFSSTRYFNKSSISSGTSAINSAWKNDLQVQLRLML